jgi:aspartyl-tRNA(Asn)/glutamyl-tRNA(Gln) amidotransferase subunit A
LADLDGGVRGRRVALAMDAYFGNVEAEIAAAVSAAAEVFSALGATVREVDLTALGELARASRLIVAADAAAYHNARLQDAPESFGAEVRARLERDAHFSAVEYAEARQAQTLVRHCLERLFADYDVLLTPTVPLPAAPLDEAEAIQTLRARLSQNVGPFNMAGLPAISVPCGLTAAGLPIGLQIVGAAWAEGAVLRAAAAYSNASTSGAKSSVYSA